jgi:hypothetical protein
VIFDGYRLADGFNMPLSCNYPEAYKEGETYVKNFTAMMSRDRIDSSSSTVFTSLYPGNGYFEDRIIGLGLANKYAEERFEVSLRVYG